MPAPSASLDGEFASRDETKRRELCSCAVPTMRRRVGQGSTCQDPRIQTRPGARRLLIARRLPLPPTRAVALRCVASSSFRLSTSLPISCLARSIVQRSPSKRPPCGRPPASVPVILFKLCSCSRPSSCLRWQQGRTRLLWRHPDRASSTVLCWRSGQKGLALLDTRLRFRKQRGICTYVYKHRRAVCQSRCEPFSEIATAQGSAICNKHLYYAAELCTRCLDANAAKVGYKDTTCRPDELNVDDFVGSTLLPVRTQSRTDRPFF